MNLGTTEKINFSIVPIKSWLLHLQMLSFFVMFTMTIKLICGNNNYSKNLKPNCFKSV